MLPPLGIDLIIIGVLAYVFGYAAQGIETQRAYWVEQICFPLSIVCFLVAPWLIV